MDSPTLSHINTGLILWPVALFALYHPLENVGVLAVAGHHPNFYISRCLGSLIRRSPLPNSEKYLKQVTQRLATFTCNIHSVSLINVPFLLLFLCMANSDSFLRTINCFDGFLFPKGCQTPRLPFSFIFFILSAWVPTLRCLGLQHPRLSHRCKILIPFGISPMKAR